MRHKSILCGLTALALAILPNTVTGGPNIHHDPQAIALAKELMTTQHLFDDLGFDEGLRLYPYKCTQGYWTIGVGHNIDADPAMKPRLAELRKKGITREEAIALFEKDLAAAKQQLDKALPWWRELDDVRQDVMVNMTFNMGISRFVNGWPNFLKLVKSGDYAAAARKISGSKNYVAQVKGRAHRLAYQLETGIRARAKPA